MRRDVIGGARRVSLRSLLALLAFLPTASAAAEEASVPGERSRYSLVTPLDTLAFDDEAMTGEPARWSIAQAAPSSPGEESPIPFEVGKGAEPEPWPYALPFLADRVIKEGYSLPLPRGLSLVYTYVQRDIKITSVKLGIDGAPLRDVSKFVNLGSTSHVNVLVGRFDAWLLALPERLRDRRLRVEQHHDQGHRDDPSADAEG